MKNVNFQIEDNVQYDRSGLDYLPPINIKHYPLVDFHNLKLPTSEFALSQSYFRLVCLTSAINCTDNILPYVKDKKTIRLRIREYL